MIPQDSIKPSLTKPPGWGKRHIVALLGFFGFAMSYAMRFNLSLAIVYMVKRNVSSEQRVSSVANETTSFNYVPVGDIFDEDSAAGKTAGEFDWDGVQQGIILGSFFWGYMSTQLLGGVLAQKFGGKWLFGVGLCVTAIFAILTPIAARTHIAFLIAARVIQGFGEGVTTPAMHKLLSQWVPPGERGTLASVTYSGCQFGTAATMVLSGYLIQANVFGGWPSVFYVIGGITIVWFILWTVFIYESPLEHPKISGEELYYIQRSIGDQLSKTNIPTPWRKMATSIPLWAIIVAHTGHTWGLYTLLTELPTYMKTILNFDIKQNSWMSALPYAVMCITGFIVPPISDVFVRRNWLTTVNVRKCCQVIAHGGAALALIGAAYSGNNPTLTVILFTIAGAVNGAIFGGFGVNHIDIASNHAGVLMGITNTVATSSGFIAPYVAGVLINGHSTLDRWRIVFYISAAVYIVDTLIFLICASGEEQSWNRGTSEFTVNPVLIGSTADLLTVDEEEDDDAVDANVIVEQKERTVPKDALA